HRDVESSTGLFASPANLSDPIPTSRRKKTFDKCLDVLTNGPSRTGSLVFHLESRQSLSTTEDETNRLETFMEIIGNQCVFRDR
ncbi:hypothetical protein WH47_07786, partial [Habropoda laboriosa]